MVASHPDEIVVGLSISLTGGFARQGRQALLGLRLWADEVNRAGGLPLPSSPAPGRPPGSPAPGGGRPAARSTVPSSPMPLPGSPSPGRGRGSGGGGRPLRLVYHDDASRAAGARDNTRRLIADDRVPVL